MRRLGFSGFSLIGGKFAARGRLHSPVRGVPRDVREMAEQTPHIPPTLRPLIHLTHGRPIFSLRRHGDFPDYGSGLPASQQASRPLWQAVRCPHEAVRSDMSAAKAIMRLCSYKSYNGNNDSRLQEQAETALPRERDRSLR